MGGRRRRDRSPSYSDYYYSDESRSPSRDRRRRRRRRGSRKRRGGGGKGTSTVDRFIRENELSESAAARLRGAAREVRDACIDQGWNVIENARNASAVVVSRIKKIEDSMKGGGGGGGGRDRSRSPPPRSGGGGGGGGGDVREGDWHCKSCGAHNFARRTECFKCGAPRGSSRSRGRSRSRSRS
ncbi:NRP1 [Symbiodinium sp. CCMP2592]|nr:NRP1 [Symbiodinium sp. CCMP2592]